MKRIGIVVGEEKRFPLPWVVESVIASRKLQVVDRLVFPYLVDLCRKIESFIKGYFSLNAIVALVDVERDLCKFLHSFCMPRLNDVEGNSEEIDLDAETEVSDTSFEWFGVGPLLRHPAISQVFKKLSSSPLELSTILQQLSQYDGPDSAFVEHLQHLYKVSDINSELNVSIDVQGLSAYRSCLRHVIRGVDFASLQSKDNVHSAENRTKSVQMIKYKSHKLKPPSEDSTTHSVLQKCRKTFDSPYPPSKKKVGKVMQDLGLARESLQNLAVEYIMLHMGSSKYRQARYERANDESESLIQQQPSILAKRKAEERDEEKSALHKVHGGLAKSGSYTKNEFSMEYLSKSSLCVEVNNKSLLPYLPNTQTVNFGDIKALGKWGEALVYQYLLANHPQYDVEWVNEGKEALTAYDIKLTPKETKSLKETRFVEGTFCLALVSFALTFTIVKTTKYSDKNVFEISLNEWNFMRGGGGSIHYDIYRVYSAGNPEKVCIAILKDAFQAVAAYKAQLCLAI